MSQQDWTHSGLEVGCALNDEARNVGRAQATKSLSGLAGQRRFHPAGQAGGGTTCILPPKVAVAAGWKPNWRQQGKEANQEDVSMVRGDVMSNGKDLNTRTQNRQELLATHGRKNCSQSHTDLNVRPRHATHQAREDCPHSLSCEKRRQ